MQLQGPQSEELYFPDLSTVTIPAYVPFGQSPYITSFELASCQLETPLPSQSLQGMLHLSEQMRHTLRVSLMFFSALPVLQKTIEELEKINVQPAQIIPFVELCKVVVATISMCYLWDHLLSFDELLDEQEQELKKKQAALCTDGTTPHTEMKDSIICKDLIAQMKNDLEHNMSSWQSFACTTNRPLYKSVLEKVHALACSVLDQPRDDQIVNLHAFVKRHIQTIAKLLPQRHRSPSPEIRRTSDPNAKRPRLEPSTIPPGAATG